MSEIWECQCGKTNTIVNRYCPSCSREIPRDYLAAIADEEIGMATEKRIKNRHIFVRDNMNKLLYGYGPGAVLFCLTLVAVLLSLSSLRAEFCGRVSDSFSVIFQALKCLDKMLKIRLSEIENGIRDFLILLDSKLY